MIAALALRARARAARLGPRRRPLGRRPRRRRRRPDDQPAPDEPRARRPRAPHGLVRRRGQLGRARPRDPGVRPGRDRAVAWRTPASAASRSAAAAAGSSASTASPSTACSRPRWSPPTGACVVASADRNPDLFWALKGGGGNFGVVTGFEFQLHEVGPLVYGGMMFFPIDAAVDLLKAYRGFMEDAPDEICGGAAILCAPPEEFVPEEVRGKPVLAVIACYVGPGRGGRARLRPAARVGPGARDARADAVRGGAGADRAGQPARAATTTGRRASSASSPTRRSRPSSPARPT